MRQICLALLCLTGAAEDATPNRPSFSSGAATTHAQTLEVEFGLSDSRSDGALNQPLLLKYGMTKRLEFRLGTVGVLDPSRWGCGDVTYGLQYQLAHRDQTTWAIQYGHKSPTAKRGFGTGMADDQINLIRSADWGPVHVDINVLKTWLGGPGRVVQNGKTLSVSYAFNYEWGVGCEFYSLSATPVGLPLASNLISLTRRIRPSLVVDVGVDVGLTRGSGRTVLVGFTYNLGNIRI